MHKFDKTPHFLHPSAMFIGRDSEWITTILGSCVAVCLFDKNLGIGGMNHFMLPYWNGEGLESPKYGNVSIVQLFQKMLDFGSKKEDIVCKIFGGAEVLTENCSVFNVGQRNVELAFKIVSDLKIEVKSSSIAGNHGRKIYFNTGTGEVLQKYLVKSMKENNK